MGTKRTMTLLEKLELEEYRATGLTPRQIKSFEREAARMREYIEFLETL